MARTSKPRAVRGLGTISVGALNRELARRRQVASQLEAKRDGIARKLAALDRTMRRYGLAPQGSTNARRSGRARGRGGQTLAEALASLLTGKTMRVTEMAEAVQTAGYATTSPNFRTIVNATVTRETKVFRRVGRGRYTAR